MFGHFENSYLCLRPPVCGPLLLEEAMEIFDKRWRCFHDAAERQSRQELRHGVAIPSAFTAANAVAANSYPAFI